MQKWYQVYEYLNLVFYKKPDENVIICIKKIAHDLENKNEYLYFSFLLFFNQIILPSMNKSRNYI